MQVSDAGALMRATLQASLILMRLRGMMPLTVGAAELDVRKWLKQKDAIEELDEDIFNHVAGTFTAEMLDHENKQVVLGRASAPPTRKKPAAKKAQGKKKKATAKKRRAQEDDDNDEEQEPDHVVHSGPLEQFGKHLLHMQGKVYEIQKLVENAQEFVPHIYPLVFGCSLASDRRPHPMLDYPLAVVVHTGYESKDVTQTIKTISSRVDALRQRQCRVFGYTEENAKTMPCRIMLILWGESYLPSQESYKKLQSNVVDMNRTARDDGTNLTFEAYSVLELQSDLTKHEDVGDYEIVRDPASEPQLKTILPHQFPYMHDTDPQAKLRDYRPGQIVRVTRRDFELGGRTSEYRVVVAFDRLLEGKRGVGEDEKKE